MKKMTLILLFSVFVLNIQAQVEIVEDNISIKLVKARKIKATSITWGNSLGTVISGPDSKRVQIRLKMRSLDGKKQLFDPNKFYFVNDEYEVRISIAEIRYAGLVPTKAFYRINADETSNEELPHNSFYDYPYKNYKDIPLQLNYGTNRKPKIKTIYFSSNTINKNTIDLFIVVPNELNEGRIYYGDTLIKDITFD